MWTTWRCTRGTTALLPGKFYVAACLEPAADADAFDAVCQGTRRGHDGRPGKHPRCPAKGVQTQSRGTLAGAVGGRGCVSQGATRRSGGSHPALHANVSLCVKKLKRRNRANSEMRGLAYKREGAKQTPDKAVQGTSQHYDGHNLLVVCSMMR